MLVDPGGTGKLLISRAASPFARARFAPVLAGDGMTGVVTGAWGLVGSCVVSDAELGAEVPAAWTDSSVDPQAPASARIRQLVTPSAHRALIPTRAMTRVWGWRPCVPAA
jgi:hypothetical protein